MYIESRLDSEITGEDQKIREINSGIVSDHAEVKNYLDFDIPSYRDKYSK